MASLKVICPKCLKGQQVVVDIPPAGIDHVCLLCKTSFRIRPPATPSSDDLPAPREDIPRPGDLPVPRGSLGTAADLPAPREAVPSPLDLPASRETVPRPGDLPVDRNAIPRPGDLPVDRNAFPRPGDLPVDRSAVPRPGDLPVDRNAVPRPGDLPIDRNAVPRPGDLPVDRNAVPRPILPPFAPPGAAAPPAPAPTSPAAKSGRMPVKTPPLGLSLDLPQPPPPTAGESLTLDDPFAQPKGTPSLELGLPPAPMAPVAAKPAPPPTPKAPRPPTPKAPPPLPKSSPRSETKPLDAGKPAVSLPHPGVGAADPTLQSLSSGPPVAKASGQAPESRPAARHKPILAPLVPEPTESEPSPGAGSRGAPPPTAATGGPTENADLGFSLEFESSPRTSSGSSPVAIPFPAARVASEGMAEAAAESEGDVPLLAPPSPRSASAGRAMRPMARKYRLPRWVYFAGGAAVVVAAAAAIAVPLLRSAPNPDNVIKPFLPELAQDDIVAYQNAATSLKNIAANFGDAGAQLKLKAAELLLVSAAAHGGGPNDVAFGEQAVAAAKEPKLEPAVRRVRALIAIINGKRGEADKLLTDKNAPESQLALGLARLSENKLAAAVAPLRAYVGARPADLLGHYLLGRALDTGPEARKEFELVLGKNPGHAGAQIELARLQETPEKRLAAARALAEKKLASAGPTELGTLELVIGQAHQALGRSLEAMSQYQKAIGIEKRLTAAYLALGEVLLYEGKYAQALERLKAAGPTLEATPAGKFALGGAYIAGNDPARGLPLVVAAAKEQADDPRGPFWNGFASAAKQPPDFAAAEQGYREALKKDPKFLPASLKLAAILQLQNKAQESLSVLRAAEEAGAPPSVLQLAWGEALIVAGEPAKAQEVFEKALDADPKSVAALLGIAAALEAQGKLEEAKVSLERTLKAFPESLGLRERLASICLKLGQKSEALALYQAEIQAGHPSVSVRLAVARLALDLDKIELAQSETKKVFDSSPRNAEAAYYMARVYESRNSTGLALTEYRHAVTWGNTPLFALGYGRLLDKLGKQQEALASFVNAVSLPEGRMARGRIFFRSGDVDNALADFEAAAKMNPKDAEPLILQGMCFDKLGQADKADAAWRAALKVDPDAPEPHYRLGRTEMDRAKTAAAIEHFNKALAKSPEKAPYLPDLTFQLAQAQLLSGAKAAAVANFKKYLEIAPPNAPARPEAERQVVLLSGKAPAGERELFDNQRLLRR